MGATAVTVDATDAPLHQLVAVDVDHQNQIDGAAGLAQGVVERFGLGGVLGISEQHIAGGQIVAREQTGEHQIAYLVGNPPRLDGLPGQTPGFILFSSHGRQLLGHFFHADHGDAVLFRDPFGDRGLP